MPTCIEGLLPSRQQPGPAPHLLHGWDTLFLLHALFNALDCICWLNVDLNLFTRQRLDLGDGHSGWHMRCMQRVQDSGLNEGQAHTANISNTLIIMPPRRRSTRCSVLSFWML